MLCEKIAMRNHLVQKYMDVFYCSGDFDELYGIFSADLEFDGPLHSFRNAKSYIDSLKEQPPVDCHYEILNEYYTDGSVCLIYRFIKGEISTVMAQTFLIDNGLIKAIRLIFDVRAII